MERVKRQFRGRPLVPGTAAGAALISDQPLSFWGGYDHRDGSIVDRRHPLNGERACGRILGIPFTRGSSTTTAVLVESVKAGTAPAAVICSHIDAFLSLAAIVADALYGLRMPVVMTTPDDFQALRTGQRIEVRLNGTILIKGDT
jgi:predicted aconitase with swiveling domain